jgi:uncharacterized membrane protein
VLIGLALIFTAVVYGRLPERMPVHWSWQGEVDRWGGRLEGALLLPGLALVIWLLLRFLPRIDPRRANYERFQGTYDLLINLLVTAIVACHVLLLGKALGWPLPVARLLPALLGVLLIAIGNMLPRARPNWWFGIRTPWTLSSDRVWARTHRVGGYLLVGAGVVWLVSALLPARYNLQIGLAALSAAVLISAVYSYVAWRKERSA